MILAPSRSVVCSWLGLLGSDLALAAPAIGKKRATLAKRRAARREKIGDAESKDSIQPMNPLPSTASQIDPRWAWHFRTLTAARRRLHRELTERVNEAVATGGAEGDSIDRAGEELDRDVALALLGAEGQTLAEIDDAIRRIERGTYGTCQASGQPIPAARLRAIPWCRYIASVEAAREHLPPPPSHA